MTPEQPGGTRRPHPLGAGISARIITKRVAAVKGVGLESLCDTQKCREIAMVGLSQRRHQDSADQREALVGFPLFDPSAPSQIGYYAEACDLAGQEAELRKRVQGAAHPDTLKALGSFAENCFRSGRHEEAISAARQVFDLSATTSGEKSTQSQTAARWLASYCYTAGVAPPADVVSKTTRKRNPP